MLGRLPTRRDRYSEGYLEAPRCDPSSACESRMVAQPRRPSIDSPIRAVRPVDGVYGRKGSAHGPHTGRRPRSRFSSSTSNAPNAPGPAALVPNASGVITIW